MGKHIPLITGQKPGKEFAMKRMIAVLAAGFLLTILAGCITLPDSYTDDPTTVFLPDGTVQWAAALNTYAGRYARKNSNADGGARYNRLYAEFTEQAKKKISLTALSSTEELEQLGKKVFPDPEAEGNLVYKQVAQRLEQRLRTLPPGTRMVFGAASPDQHEIAMVAFLTGDGSFEFYFVED
jgi:hypothetical protein